ncbi:MAG: sugar phosphate nucleotidyltransferase [Gemmatirosa sp.]
MPDERWDDDAAPAPVPQRVQRAIVPCGGRGTRMRALTGGAPKEMLPVGGVPLVEHVARECAASGVDELLVIVAPGKDAIAAHLAPLAGSPGMPRRISFLEQPDARGLADAIRLGRAFAGEAPVAVALPDNLFVGDAPGVAQVAATFARTGRHVVAVVEITREEAARRGPTAVLPGTRDGDHFEIAQIPDKGARGATFDTRGAHAAHTGVGRYVFRPDVFDAIDAVERALPATQELDDVPVLQHLLARGQLVGHCMRGRFLDAGLPDGYAEARAYLERA